MVVQEIFERRKPVYRFFTGLVHGADVLFKISRGAGGVLQFSGPAAADPEPVLLASDDHSPGSFSPTPVVAVSKSLPNVSVSPGWPQRYIFY